MPDPTRLAHAADYAGSYTCGARTLTLSAEDSRLILQYSEERIALEQRGRDTFYVDHADFALFLLRFGRVEGQVVEAYHGADWYRHDRYLGPSMFDYPPECPFNGVICLNHLTLDTAGPQEKEREAGMSHIERVTTALFEGDPLVVLQNQR